MTDLLRLIAVVAVVLLLEVAALYVISPPKNKS